MTHPPHGRARGRGVDLDWLVLPLQRTLGFHFQQQTGNSVLFYRKTSGCTRTSLIPPQPHAALGVCSRRASPQLNLPLRTLSYQRPSEQTNGENLWGRQEESWRRSEAEGDVSGGREPGLKLRLAVERSFLSSTCAGQAQPHNASRFTTPLCVVLVADAVHPQEWRRAGGRWRSKMWTITLKTSKH